MLQPAAGDCGTFAGRQDALMKLLLEAAEAGYSILEYVLWYMSCIRAHDLRLQLSNFSAQVCL